MSIPYNFQIVFIAECTILFLDKISNDLSPRVFVRQWYIQSLYKSPPRGLVKFLRPDGKKSINKNVEKVADFQTQLGENYGEHKWYKFY